MGTRTIPLEDAMRDARDVADVECNREFLGTIPWLIEYHRALAARGWPLWPQEPTEEMLRHAAFAGPDRYEPDGTMEAVYPAMRSALPSLDELLNPKEK